MKIVIFGATSAIAQSAARVWAAQGATLTVCGRDAEKLAIVAEDLRARGAAAVASVVFDGGTVDGCEKAAQAALAHGCDVALIAHGVLTDQEACKANAQRLAAAMQVNFVGFAIIAEALAAHFETQKSGALILISSVAGDRGRALNYLYGAAKAGVTALASGLRGRLAKVGVNVITLKPGFVSTPMTAHLKRGALFVGPDVVGRAIVASVERRRAVVYTPSFWRVIMGILSHVPERLFHKLPI